MKLYAIICFWDESATFLSSCVSSLGKLGIDHLIACDGSYILFPKGGNVSSVESHQAIQWTCRSLDIGCTLHVPAEKWRGNEVEKRNFSFKLATHMLTPEDWLFVIDADEVIDLVNVDVKAALEASDLDVASCIRTDRIDQHGSDLNAFLAQHVAIDNVTRSPTRRFFRALPDLRVVSNHHTYVAGQGEDEKLLWSPLINDQAQALDLESDVVIEHRNHMRDRLRFERAWEFYAIRDETGIEPLYVRKT